MKISRLLTFLHNLVDSMNPMAPASKWMLRNAPTFWRASVLKILWYFLLGFLILVLLGTIIANRMTNIPTMAELMGFQTWVYAMSGIVFTGWVVSLFRCPTIDLRLPQTVSTIAIYAAFIYGLLILPNAYLIAVSGRIMQLYDVTHLEADKTAIKYSFQELCGTPTEDNKGLNSAIQRLYVGRQNRENTKQLVERIKAVEHIECVFGSVLQKYSNHYTGYEKILDIDDAIKVMSTVREGHLFYLDELDEDKLYDFHKEVIGDNKHLHDAAESFSVTEYLAVVTHSFHISSKSGLRRWLDGILSLSNAILSCLAAIILLVAERLCSPIASATRNVRANWKKLGNNKLNFGFRKLDRNLLISRPKLWVSRLHSTMIPAILVFLTAFFIIGLTEHAYNFTNEILEHRIPRLAVGLTFIFLFLVIFISLGLILLRSQVAYIKIDRSSSGALVRAFFALYSPISLVLFLLLVAGPLTRNFANVNTWNDVNKLDEMYAVSGFGVGILFVIVLCYIGVIFSNVGATLRALAVVLTIGAASLALIITFNNTLDEIGYVLAPIVLAYILLVSIWPKQIFEKTDSDSTVLILCFLGAYIPWANLTIYFTIFEYLELDIADDSVLFSIVFFSYIAIPFIIIRLMQQLQRRHVEPQEH